MLLLQSYAEERDLGEAFGSRTAVEIASDQVPESDILFVCKERLGIIQDKGIVGPPDLVIEILSASTLRNDRGPKFRAYERAGVRELWLIDPYGPDGTQFFQLQGMQLVEVQANKQDIIPSSAVPGFWIDVQWLWPGERFISVRQALTARLSA